MSKTNSKQAINAVAMKRQAQAKIYADTKSMSVADQIAYFRRRAQAGALGEWWKHISSLPTDASALVVREKPSRVGQLKAPGLKAKR